MKKTLLLLTLLLPAMVFSQEEDPEMKNILVSILSKAGEIIFTIIIGLTTSFLFLKYYLSQKVPKITISPHICKKRINEETNYLFKIVNNTNCEIFDLKVELTLLRPYNSDTGKNIKSKDIKLVDANFYHLRKKEKKDQYNMHALIFRTTENLEELWGEDENHKELRITVIGKHSLSGFNKVFTHNFLTRNSIVNKNFNNGDDAGVS